MTVTVAEIHDRIDVQASTGFERTPIQPAKGERQSENRALASTNVADVAERSSKPTASEPTMGNAKKVARRVSARK